MRTPFTGAKLGVRTPFNGAKLGVCIRFTECPIFNVLFSIFHVYKDLGRGQGSGRGLRDLRP